MREPRYSMRADVTKLLVDCRNFAKKPKKEEDIFLFTLFL